MKKLIYLVEQWSIDRNINEANPIKQYDKLIEEYGELVKGLNKNDKNLIKDSIGDMLVVMIIMMQQVKGDMEYAVKISEYGEDKANTVIYVKSLSILGENLEGLTSDKTNGELFIGIQTMISNIIYLLKQTAADHNMNLITCLNAAYDEIKDRKGKMIDGKFVKESDL